MTKEEFENGFGSEVTEEFYEEAMRVRYSMLAVRDDAFLDYIKNVPMQFITHLSNGIKIYEEKTTTMKRQINDLQSEIEESNIRNLSRRSYDDEEIGNLLYDVMREEQDDDQVRDTCIALLGSRNYVERVLDDSNISEEDKDIIKDLID